MRLKFKPRWMASVVVAASPVAALAAAPESTTEFVFDLWNTPRHERHVRAFREADARMDLELRDSSDRIAIKERLVADLIANRNSFDAVVQQFAVLNEGRPLAYARILEHTDGATEEEKAAFSVLCYVSNRGNPVGSALPRFAAEYEARFGRTFLEK